MQAEIERLITRGAALLERLERMMAGGEAEPDWSAAIAFRWRRQGRAGELRPVRHPHGVRLCDLVGIDAQKAEVERNTRQFVAGLPANNVLLWGSRGTGKSSLIKALLNEYAGQGLRLIEIERHVLRDLPEIIDPLYERPERFVLFCDDLSFEAGDAGYKTLKAMLDGSVAVPPDNVLVYATSNRRHLLPEYLAENEQAHRMGEEVHPGEAVEEKISLSERFGLWVSFYPFPQDEYLAIVWHWLRRLGAAESSDPEAVRAAALQWALARGSRSGRVAWQFARDWAGRVGI
jgi:uncharacterized protein